MQNMGKKENAYYGNCIIGEFQKQKERHIVSWSQEEDDTLREQIRIHGTENWVIIASKFKDKTTRQCRRRWYTYLNSDFKRGGWSPEEDTLLCEAQKIFGNRWTEIAKVVPGRTDNAVKNRFCTLRKKRAKNQALEKENHPSSINLNDEKVICNNRINTDRISATEVPHKKMRTISDFDLKENCNHDERLHKKCGTTNQQLRPPFAVLVQNYNNVSDSPNQHQVINKEVFSNGASNDNIQGFLKKGDPKIVALVQQAELLSSLALKVNTENTDQSLENAWKDLQDFLNRAKGSDMLRFKMSDMDFQLENFKEVVEDLRSSNKSNRSSRRQTDFYESSSGSSDNSSGSILLCDTVDDKMEHSQAELCAPYRDPKAELQTIHIGEQNGMGDGENRIVLGETTNQEFSSPLQVTPLFRSLAAGIPSPKFSESERKFLLKTLGMDSTSPNRRTNSAQPPPCKRALLHDLGHM